MTTVIEKGTAADTDELEQLYGRLHEHLGKHINYPGWISGIYPARDTAESGIGEGCLYVARECGNREPGPIAGTVILRREPEPGYEKAAWHTDLDYRDILVVYTLAVHPDYLNKGVGMQLMDFIISHAEAEGAKAVRLDVYEKNLPAIRLYRKYGFQYIDTVDLGYGKYGLDRFELYQKLL